MEVSKKDLDRSYRWSEAIKACKDSREGGFKNWFLPHTEMLFFIHQNQDEIGGFAFHESYWSSSENSENDASTQFFDMGYYLPGIQAKDNKYLVRCARAF